MTHQLASSKPLKSRIWRCAALSSVAHAPTTITTDFGWCGTLAVLPWRPLTVTFGKVKERRKNWKLLAPNFLARLRSNFSKTFWNNASVQVPHIRNFGNSARKFGTFKTPLRRSCISSDHSQTTPRLKPCAALLLPCLGSRSRVPSHLPPPRGSC